MDSGNTPESKTKPTSEANKAEIKTKPATSYQAPTLGPVTQSYQAAVPPVAPHKPKEKKGNGASAAAVVISIFSLLIAVGGIGFGIWAYENRNAPKVVEGGSSSNGYYNGNTVQFEETSIAGIVSKVTPAVVSIVVESEQEMSGAYRYIYGETQLVQAAGTGMIVTSDGYIITNKHVAKGAKNIQIIMDNGDTYEDVKVVGLDPLNDVAYLKINGVSDLPTVTLGDSKTLSVGQPVLAIGNALGAFQNSVTQGIVSGVGRTITAYEDEDDDEGETLSDLIQTDAAINHGNSGGPLVNAAGEVIGINSATSETANGLGFAIPISATKGMLNSIIENDKAQRAVMGVAYISVTPEVMKAYDLPVNYGAYLISQDSRGRSQSAVVSGGPADKAGIKDGDIITKINGVAIGSAGTLSSLVGEYKVGDTIEVEFMRDDKTMTTNVTLTAYED